MIVTGKLYKKRNSLLLLDVKGDIERDHLWIGWQALRTNSFKYIPNGTTTVVEGPSTYGFCDHKMFKRVDKIERLVW